MCTFGLLGCRVGVRAPAARSGGRAALGKGGPGEGRPWGRAALGVSWREGGVSGESPGSLRGVSGGSPGGLRGFKPPFQPPSLPFHFH